MSEAVLEREKELQKWNETINSKCVDTLRPINDGCLVKQKLQKDLPKPKIVNSKKIDDEFMRIFNRKSTESPKLSEMEKSNPSIDTDRKLNAKQRDSNVDQKFDKPKNLAIVPPNLSRKNVSTDGIIKWVFFHAIKKKLAKT